MTLEQRSLDADSRNLTDSLWQCRYRHFKYVDLSTGETKAFVCRSWNCPEHGSLVRWRWKMRLGGIPWAHFWTVTLVPESKPDAVKAWRKLRDWLMGLGVTTYIRALEIGEGGMRHYHLLTYGEPQTIVGKAVETTFGSDELNSEQEFQRWVSESVLACGYGSVVHVSRVRRGAASVQYLLGYVTKGGDAHRARYLGWRRLVVSRNVISWEKVHEQIKANIGGIDSSGGSYVLQR